MPTMTTTVDPRSTEYADRRHLMLARLDELDEACVQARTRIRARERVELLLDRDAPFLELYPVAGTRLVGGVGLVEDVPCVIVAEEPIALDGAGDRDKAYRLASLAGGYDLPLVHLAEPGRTRRELRRAATVIAVAFGPEAPAYGDYTVAVRAGDADFVAADERDAVRLARLCVHRLGREAVPEPPGPGRPPAYEPEDLLGTADVREILARILDGSDFDEFQEDVEPVAGWGAVHGYPVGVVAGEAGTGAKATRFSELVRASGTPLVALRTGSDTTMIDVDGRLVLGWPGTPADAVIDPRDTRTALGLALALIRRSA